MQGHGKYVSDIIKRLIIWSRIMFTLSYTVLKANYNLRSKQLKITTDYNKNKKKDFYVYYR